MIKFIYFDVGGVVVKDFSASNKWKELQHELGVSAENEEKFQQVWMKYRSKICVDYDIEKLIPVLNSEVGLSIPSNYSLLNGFISRFEKNESIWPIIEKVKKSTKMGLLTNMYVNMFEHIQKKGILPQVKWDKVVDSSVVRLQKPDKALFEFAEKEVQIDGKDILFIDNQEKHVLAAKQCGWQAYVYDSADYVKSSRQLEEFFEHVGVI
ncbi:MAG: hypothetical protein NTV98_01230 [Candidatus Roizmanbacteria bacterium]|nr:hypothetical protein [Candidatus Roizmanbacteria bacterium]